MPLSGTMFPVAFLQHCEISESLAEIKLYQAFGVPKLYVFIFEVFYMYLYFCKYNPWIYVA